MVFAWLKHKMIFLVKRPFILCYFKEKKPMCPFPHCFHILYSEIFKYAVWTVGSIFEVHLEQSQNTQNNDSTQAFLFFLVCIWPHLLKYWVYKPKKTVLHISEYFCCCQHPSSLRGSATKFSMRNKVRFLYHL